jgi:hypothetical protein
LHTCENQRNIKQGNIVRKYIDWRDSEQQALLAKTGNIIKEIQLDHIQYI